MNKKFLIPLLACIFAMAGALMSCDSGEAPKKTTHKKTEGKTEAKLPLAVSVYLDNSASMKGYFTNPGELVNILAGIQTKYTGESLQGYYLQKGTKGTDVKAIDFKEMASMLSTKSMNTTDAYQLDEFINTIDKKAAADTKHASISFLVTDGILSGTDAQIRKNPNYNIDNASLLRNNIANAIRPLTKRGYGAAIFQFSVNFSGTYYNYHNGTKTFTGKRPLYVIAIGPNKDVAEFAKQAQAKAIKDFTPSNTVVITAADASISPAVSSCKKSGNTFNALPKKSDVKRVNGADYANMRITIPLSSLPTFLQDETALRQAIEISYVEPIDKNNIKVNNGRVVIPVKVKRLTAPQFTLSIMNTTPGWVSEYTSLNDENVSNQANKTFNLSYLVDGLTQGVNESGSSLVFGPQTYTIDWKTGKYSDN